MLGTLPALLTVLLMLAVWAEKLLVDRPEGAERADNQLTPAPVPAIGSTPAPSATEHAALVTGPEG